MLTNREKHLVDLLQALWNEKEFICAVVQYGRDKNRTEDIITYIERADNVTSDDVLEYAYRLTPTQPNK